MSIRTLRNTPLTLDNKKLDIKSQIITLSIKNKVYFLLSKGIIRKALISFNNANPEKLSVLTAIKLQSQSFKYKKHAEASVNSINYMISILNSRAKSSEVMKKNMPESAGELVNRIKELVFGQIREKVLVNETFNCTLDLIKKAESEAKEVFKDVKWDTRENVKLYCFVIRFNS